ncbi:MAG: Rrf2 family transcriptional regulator [Xenococcaceae cyanobacterium MO_167.B27]|nr:Rrf2 family transcriptional regulator [Xenococcaceae cyanobacterium MO_167.B27]
MTKSTRFAVAVHILTFLSANQGEYVSSDAIAKSVATNPVAVRKILGMLVKARFVSSLAGSRGGARLEIDPKKLSLLDIYKAVEQKEIFQMHTPHPSCPLAKRVKVDLQQVFDAAQKAMEQQLADKTLQDVSRQAVLNFNQVGS